MGVTVPSINVYIPAINNMTSIQGGAYPKSGCKTASKNFNGVHITLKVVVLSGCWVGLLVYWDDAEK